MTQDEIQAVARAMCLAGGFDPDEIMPNDGPRWGYYTDGAQAAIAAIDAARGKAEPVAWMYHHPSHPKRRPPASVDFIRVEGPLGDGWIETPLYAHPPADRVAQVVEFIREQQANAHRHMLEASHRKTASHFAAAFVTLRNLVDAIERGEPFNG